MAAIWPKHRKKASAKAYERRSKLRELRLEKENADGLRHCQ